MVKYLNYKDKKIPYRVSYFAMKMTSQELQKKTGEELDLEQILSGNIEVLEPLLFYSITAGCKFVDEAIPVKRDEMEWILDICFLEFTGGIQDFFPNQEVSKAKTATPKKYQKNK